MLKLENKQVEVLEQKYWTLLVVISVKKNVK